MDTQSQETVSWRKEIPRGTQIQDSQVPNIAPRKGEIYRIRRMRFLDFYRDYPVDYDLGLCLYVRSLEDTPDKYGIYKFTTRGEDGEHLGPGGGWLGDSILYLKPSCLERITDVTLAVSNKAA